MQHPISSALFSLALVLGSACGGASTPGTTPEASNGGGRAQVGYAADATRGDQEAFTRRFVADFRRIVPDEGCEYAGARMVACGDAQVSLDRMWAFCSENPADCDAVVADFTSAMAEALAARGAPVEVDVAQLRVAVRTREYGDEVTARLEGSIVRPIAGDLVAVVMVDSPRTARAFGADDLSSLGLSPDDAYARALANTLAEMPQAATNPAPACGHAMAIQHDYYYESSRILDATWLASLGGGGPEPILVRVPSYESVVVARECDPATRVVVGQIGDQIARGSSSPLSTTLFRVGPDGLVPAR